MSKKARAYSESTLKKLFGLSGNQCAFPSCTKRLVNPANAKDANICHIEAANEGGERYNPAMTDKQRANYSNLILLCIQHHDETNNVEKYSVEILKDMKQKHESFQSSEKFKNNPSMLKNAINAIAKIDLDVLQEEERLNVVEPNHKIAYNSIKSNIAMIQEYKAYHEKINSLYDELERQGSIKKEKLLNNIKQIYIQTMGNYILDSKKPIEVIRENSDKIIDDVFDELYEKMQGSGAWDEDIVLGIRLIMVDAFIRCKILEEPPQK